MAGQLSSLMKQKGFVFWLMGLTIVYQLVNQVFMMRALQQQAASDDDECSAASAGSTRCLELQLFRTWQQAAPVWQSFSDDEDNGQSLIEDMTPFPSSAGNASAILATPPATPAEEYQVPTAPTTSVAVQRGEEGADHSADLQSRLELSQELDRHAQSITASLEGAEMTRWGRDLEELQENLEAKQAALPSQRRKHAQQENIEAASANSTDHENPLLDQIYQVQRAFCKDPEDPICETLMAAADARKRSMAAQTHLFTKSVGAELHQRVATLDVELAAISAESVAWQHAFEQKVDQAHKDLCEDTQRRDRPDCAKFLESIVELERQKTKAFQLARQVSKAALRANITREAKERAATLDLKLESLVSQRQVWEKQLLEKYGLSEGQSREGDPDSRTTPTQVESLQALDRVTRAQHRGRELHWPAVVAWSAGGSLRGTAGSGMHAKVERAELRAARWASTIPKVACITAVKSGPALKIQLKYFIDNFHLQSYEGATQLVFVYHYKDRAAARLVRSYADGVHIKGAVVREDGEFPSTTALRFGAWSSDADVIAHWDFHQFQHPQRLSFQVRALAYSSRPACILSGLADEGAGVSEETLLGEASWMKRHWYPFLQEQKDSLEGAQARHIVEVDMGLANHQNTGADSLASVGTSMDESLDRLVELLQEE